MRFRCSTFCLLLFLLFAASVSAETILEYSELTGVANQNINAGQKVTTPNTVEFKNLTFNWYAADDQFNPESPLAEGDELFMLSSPYFGRPDELSASTPGYIASTSSIVAEGSGTEWVFAADVTLQPNSDYFFYAIDLDENLGTAKTHSFFGGLYGGGLISSSSSSNFDLNTAFDAIIVEDWHFELEGTPALSADFDNSGIVDGLDFLKWQRGMSLDPLSQSDLDLWEAQYGGPPPIGTLATTIPEPSALILAFVLLSLSFGRDRWISSGQSILVEDKCSY